MRSSPSGVSWTLIVPVRDPRTGKSRLGASTALNTAIATDTLNAALACSEVHRLLLISDNSWWISASLINNFRCDVLQQDNGSGLREQDGLTAAVTQGLDYAGFGTTGFNTAGTGSTATVQRQRGNSGLEHVSRGHGTSDRHDPGAVAVMLGDLPSLRPKDLSAALHAGEHLPRGMVSDHFGQGTTLLTCRDAAEARHRPRFGADSAWRHRTAGYQELAIPTSSTLRYDVDTAQDLQVAHAIGLGPATAALLPSPQVSARHAASAPPASQSLPEELAHARAGAATPMEVTS